MAQLKLFDCSGTHRLIPAKYSEGSVLKTLPLPANVLADLSELDALTNERNIAEAGASSGIGPSELLFGVPEAAVVNATFCHPGPYGGRFNNAQRGAWYAGLELETSVAEVAFHKTRFLKEARILHEVPFDYVDFLADFSGAFHYLDPPEVEACLQADPIPDCYRSSQALAITLLYSGSNGIVYPSVRRAAGTCLACFRPALIFHPRRGQQYRITLKVGAEVAWHGLPYQISSSQTSQ